MGHQEDAAVLLVGDGAEQLEDVAGQRHVEPGRRLVGEQQARPAGEGGGDHHPLAHSPGQLVWVGVEASDGVAQPDLAQQRDGLGARCVAAQALVDGEAVGELAADRAHRREGAAWVLEAHRRAVTAMVGELLAGQCEHVASGDAHAPRRPRPTGQGGDDRPGDHRLAAAALADETDDLAVVDVEVDVRECLHGAPAAADLHREAADVEQRLTHEMTRSARCCSPSPMRLKASTHTSRASAGRHARPPPPGDGVVGADADHRPPLGLEHGDAESEERQAGEREHRPPAVERSEHAHGREAVGHDVVPEDPPARRPGHRGGVDVRLGAHRAHLGADEPGVGRGVDGGDDDHQVDGAGADDGGDGEGEDERRERLDDVEQAHRPLLEPAPDEPDDDADQRADDDGEEDGDDGDAEVDAGSAEQPAPHVDGVAVGAEEVGTARRMQRSGGGDLLRSARRDQRGDEGEQHDDGEQRQPDAEHPRCGPLVVPVGLDDDGGLGLGALCCEHAHDKRIRGSSTAWTMSATAKASM